MSVIKKKNKKIKPNGVGGAATEKLYGNYCSRAAFTGHRHIHNGRSSFDAVLRIFDAASIGKQLYDRRINYNDFHTARFRTPPRLLSIVRRRLRVRFRIVQHHCCNLSIMGWPNQENSKKKKGLSVHSAHCTRGGPNLCVFMGKLA